MKLLILIITVCGQPDYVLIKEAGQPPIGAKMKAIQQDPFKARDLHQYMQREDKEIITLPYDNGTCA